MNNKNRIILYVATSFFVLSGCSESTSKAKDKEEKKEVNHSKNDDLGVIYAKPEEIASNISFEEIERISTFF